MSLLSTLIGLSHNHPLIWFCLLALVLLLATWAFVELSLGVPSLPMTPKARKKAARRKPRKKRSKRKPTRRRGK